MLASGRLIPLHRGVYAVGHRALSLEGVRRRHAVRRARCRRARCGSAGHHLGIRPSTLRRIDIATPTTGRRSTAAIAFRSSGKLGPADTMRYRGVPVTSVARTVADPRVPTRLGCSPATFAARSSARRQLWSLTLQDARDAAVRRGGTALLDEMIAASSPSLTRSELEDRLLDLLRGSRPPRAAGQRDGPRHGGRSVMAVASDSWWRPTATRSTCRATPSSAIVVATRC